MSGYPVKVGILMQKGAFMFDCQMRDKNVHGGNRFPLFTQLLPEIRGLPEILSGKIQKRQFVIIAGHCFEFLFLLAGSQNFDIDRSADNNAVVGKRVLNKTGQWRSGAPEKFNPAG